MDEYCSLVHAGHVLPWAHGDLKRRFYLKLGFLAGALADIGACLTRKFILLLWER